MTLFDRLYPGYTFTSLKNENMVTAEQIDLDLDCMVALGGFSYIPADYVALFSKFGIVEFRYASLNVAIRLRHPVEAYEFSFTEENGRRLSEDSFPVSYGDGRDTIWHSNINGVRGLYLIDDSDPIPEGAIYISPSLSALLFDGVGLEVLAKQFSADDDSVEQFIDKRKIYLNQYQKFTE